MREPNCTSIPNLATPSNSPSSERAALEKRLNQPDVLGVDVGGVIIDSVSEDPVVGDRFGAAAQVAGAFEAIARLVEGRFGDRVWLVSRCSEDAEPRIRDWPERRDFFGATGVARDQVRFCRRRSDKAEICGALGVTHFVDDRLEVLSHLVGKVRHLYLFHSRVEDVERFRQFLPHVHETTRWDDILNELLT